MNLFRMIFGCWHKRYSFPLTLRRNPQHSSGVSVNQTYVVCLDCGQEFPYDWSQMKRQKGAARPALAIPNLESLTQE
jgi:hypothetical protein